MSDDDAKASLPNLYLAGFMGTGKSVLGRKLAEMKNMRFFDADDVIARGLGKPIAQIFAEEGEAEFRRLEREFIERGHPSHGCVIALGGGALGREENRQALKAGGHKLVYLRCEPAELVKRIHADPATAATRPKLTGLGGGIEKVTRLLADREPIYRSCMTAELDVTNLTPEDAVVYVARMI